LDDLNRGTSAGEEVWDPPAEGTIKINVDAAFSPEAGSAAVGVVARNHCGGLVAAVSQTIGACRDAEEAEALAILAGLQLGINYNLNVRALESDCVNAVGNANKLGADSSEYWSMYSDIKLAKSLLPNCNVSHIRRKLNKAAHSLARLASRSGVSNLWLQPCPDAILELVNRDFVNCGAE
jgi:ribonuclease HI